jgi:hypothetical protein
MTAWGMYAIIVLLNATPNSWMRTGMGRVMCVILIRGAAGVLVHSASRFVEFECCLEFFTKKLQSVARQIGVLKSSAKTKACLHLRPEDLWGPAVHHRKPGHLRQDSCGRNH